MITPKQRAEALVVEILANANGLTDTLLLEVLEKAFATDRLDLRLHLDAQGAEEGDERARMRLHRAHEKNQQLELENQRLDALVKQVAGKAQVVLRESSWLSSQIEPTMLKTLLERRKAELEAQGTPQVGKIVIARN